MEFASEMVVKASLARLTIVEVPTTLSPDGRGRPPHLRPWRDGWRHLRFMLLRSPQWLFLYPGLVLTALGIVGATMLTVGPIQVPGVFTLDINALLYFSMAAVVGMQIIFFGLFAHALGRRIHLQIASRFVERLLKLASLEAAIGTGIFVVALGVGGVFYAVLQWGHSSFGALVPSEMMRITIPSVAAVAVGAQIVFGGFLLGFIEIE
jgi:hypothetical protein